MAMWLIAEVPCPVLPGTFHILPLRLKRHRTIGTGDFSHMFKVAHVE